MRNLIKMPLLALTLIGSAHGQVTVRLQGTKDIVLADKDIKALTIEVRDPESLEPNDPEFMRATLNLSAEAARRFAAFSRANVKKRIEMLVGDKKISTILLTSEIKGGIMVMYISEPAVCGLLLEGFLKTRFTPAGSPK